MLESPLTVLAYTSAWSLGFLFLKLIRFDGSRLETACTAFLSGLFLQSWFSFLAGLAGVSLTREFFFVTDSVFVVVAMLLSARRVYSYVAGASRPGDRGAGQPKAAPVGCPAYEIKIGDNTPLFRETWFIKIALFILALYFLMHSVINAERVISFTDAVMSYDFRARAIAYEGKVYTAVYGWPEVRTPNFMYPPLITQFNAHYYALGGKNPKLIYSLLLFAVSGLTAAAVWKLSKSKLASVLSACFFAFLPVVRKYSMLEALDFPALSYFALGVTQLVLYHFEPKKPRLVLAAIGFSGGAFLRPEDPLFFAGVLAAVLWHFGWNKKGLLAVGMLAFFYGMVYGSHAYFVHSVVGADPESQIQFAWKAVFSPVRIFETSAAFIRHFASDRFMLLGPMAVLLKVFGGQDNRAGDLLWKLIVAFSLSWICLLLIDNSGDWKEMRLEWSYFRIFIRIAPLLVLYVLRHPAVTQGLNELLTRVGNFSRRPA